MGGRDHPDVDLSGPRRADRSNLAALEESQERYLGPEWKVADLIEEERPAVGDGEETGLARDRARERPRSWPNSSLGNSSRVRAPQL